MSASMIYATVCSGIESASVAVQQAGLDWRPVFFSEVAKFPRALLAARHNARAIETGAKDGKVPMFGDFTSLKVRHLRRFGISLPDILMGGTPCQSFSVAGMRQGLEDRRGNLTLKFVEMCHAINNARDRAGQRGLVIVWENVEGILLDKKTNAFGCFLGGLVGADDALRAPSGQSWPCAGMVAGPRARVAWRVLDLQYFGVPQRRRRVVLVADFGNRADPAAILFERKSGRRGVEARDPAGANTVGTITTRSGDDSSSQSASAGHLIVAKSPHPAVLAGGQVSSAPEDSVVRRLTPRECERLMGLADDYTNIVYGRPKFADQICPDAPRYKALGNAWAVPVFTWLFRRIESVMKASDTIQMEVTCG